MLGKTVVVWGLLTINLINLTGCVVHAPEQQSPSTQYAQMMQQALNQNQHASIVKNGTMIPAQAMQSLRPDLNNLVSTAAPQAQQFDISVENAPVRSFFQTLSKDSGYNIVLSPGVEGNITLKLKQVTLEQLLETVRSLYGYGYQYTSYGYNIYPRRLETQIFSVDYLNMDRVGSSQTFISSGQITHNVSTTSSGSNSNGGSTTNDSSGTTVPTSTVDTKTDNNFWPDVISTVESIVGVVPNVNMQTSSTASNSANNNPALNSNATTSSVNIGGSAADGRSVVINKQAGIVVIRAYPDQLAQVAQYLQLVQSIVNREVIIDAKILEVTLSASYQSGIDWKLLGLQQSGTGTISDELPSFTSIFSGSGSAGTQFNFLVQLLSTQGRVNVLSSPRIATINNQKALIKVGSDQFFVTGIESNTTSSSSSSDTVSQNVDLTPFFSGVALDVTPQIDEDGNIVLHIHPLISTVTQKQEKFTVSGQEQDLPLAYSTIRESDDVVRVKNRQIVIIGGLMEDKSDLERGSTPLLDHIPVFGGLFNKNNHSASKMEIVILLQPTIVDNQAWNDQLREASRRFTTLDRDFKYDTTLRPTVSSIAQLKSNGSLADSNWSGP